MKLERSIDKLAKRLDVFDPVFPSNNKTSLSYWKGKATQLLERPLVFDGIHVSPNKGIYFQRASDRRRRPEFSIDRTVYSYLYASHASLSTTSSQVTVKLS